MRYFIVFQKKTFDREFHEGMFWAPKFNSVGRPLFHWTNMKKIHPGDIILSVVQNCVVSINIATTKAFDSQMPKEFSELNWRKDGWRVNALYNPLKHPIRITNIIDEFYSLLPYHESPFQKNGRGNQGYLYELPDRAGEIIIEHIGRHNKLPNRN